MGRIRILDDALVDQIAAGEVVERPASIVKELVENSLDAGASSLSIEIEQGGVALVRVTDDGAGMDREDALLALRRHATSKIARFEDLAALRTLGFRGEALPSIASVAKLTLTTRPAAAVGGIRVRVAGGGPPEIVEVGCAPGTTVEVSDLFYNVPARRKFLKARQTEAAHVAEVCQRVALARPDLRLVLHRDGRRAREHLPVATHAERARGVLGEPDLAPIDGERDGLAVEAYLGRPEVARSGAAGLFVFVNGRAVRDRALARAVAFAYGSVLPPGRFPVGVVHLELDPAEVDVNVHPQKAEVRFARGRAVLDSLTRILASALGTSAWSGPVAPASGPAGRPADFWDARLAGQEPPEEPDPWGLAGGAAEAVSPYPTPAAAVAPAAPRLLQAGGAFGSLRVLGQVRRMLIVCEGPDGLHLIDQHAADERVRYDRLSRAYRARAVTTQRLLFPERVELSEAAAALVDEARDELLAVGLDATLVGPTTGAVHAVPALVKRAAPGRLLLDLLDELGRAGGRAFGDAVDTALATMACHGAIRAGDELSREECEALLLAMDEVDDFSGHCPHGRPVVFSVAFGEIERRLGR